MGLTDIIMNIIEKPTNIKYYNPIFYANILHGNYLSTAIEPNRCYFEFRLSQMFLRNRREYWYEYLPFAIMISKFIYDDKPRTIPFIVGSQLLQSIEQYLDGGYVEYLNTRVAGPIPYAGDDVSLFVGLFRTQVRDLSKNLFSFLENIVSAFDITQMSKYLAIAGPVCTGLGSLLGMRAMELRLGTWSEFSYTENDTRQFRDCYLAYINCPEEAIVPKELWVKNGRLYIGEDKQSIEPLRQYDFCLIRIKRLEHRNDYITLPFHRLWKEAKNLIWNGKHTEADTILLSLSQELAISPDLTQRHRLHLMQLYSANFESEVETYNALRKGRPKLPPTPTRAGRQGLSAPGVFQKIAHSAKEAGFSKEVSKGLLDISSNWSRIPHLKDRPKESQLTNEIMNEQLKELEGVSKVDNLDPKTLAEAMAVTRLNPN
jgi:hypothetical protein